MADRVEKRGSRVSQALKDVKLTTNFKLMVT
jgi:hypothetical protein